MYQPHVAFIVDHPQRDLRGLVLTAFDLCQHGITCHLVPMNLQNKEIWALAPDVVVLNYFRRNNEPFARKLHDAGIAFALLDTEGGVWPDLESYRDILWDNTALSFQAICSCMWGPKLTHYVVDQQLFPPERTKTTGCPRFNFYHPDWRPVIWNDTIKEQTGIGAVSNRKILLNTVFPMTNPRFASIEQNMRGNQAVLGWTDEQMQKLADDEQRAIEGMIEIARNLAQDFPDAQVVLRPHPFENPERYVVPLRDLPNVEVNEKGSIQSQIFTSSVVIQRSSTTAIETSMADIPTLSPQWFAAPMLMPMAEAVSVPCSSYQYMRSIVQQIFAGTYAPTTELQHAIETTIYDWFYKIDGQAHKRVNEALLASLPDRRCVNETLCSRILYGLDRPVSKLPSLLSPLLRYSLGLSPNWSFSQMRNVPSRGLRGLRKDKYFDATQVQQIIEHIKPIYQAKDSDMKPVKAALSRERGEYLHNYYGHSVTLALES
jgi:surface carbohydrate biosynthesis protein